MTAWIVPGEAHLYGGRGLESEDSENSGEIWMGGGVRVVYLCPFVEWRQIVENTYATINRFYNYLVDAVYAKISGIFGYEANGDNFWK